MKDETWNKLQPLFIGLLILTIAVLSICLVEANNDVKLYQESEAGLIKLHNSDTELYNNSVKNYQQQIDNITSLYNNSVIMYDNAITLYNISNDRLIEAQNRIAELERYINSK